jgi:hypothetical protein
MSALAAREIATHPAINPPLARQRMEMTGAADDRGATATKAAEGYWPELEFDRCSYNTPRGRRMGRPKTREDGHEENLPHDAL